MATTSPRSSKNTHKHSSSHDLFEKKTIHFVSLGCPKNRVDSEVMAGVAHEAGFSLTQDAENAEVIVINTCGFIGEAKQESIDTILELAELKTEGSCKKLVVAGCLSQRYPTELASGMTEVDHFLGSSDMLKLRNVLKESETERMLVGNPADWVIRASDPRIVTQSTVSAYLKLAEGCNRSCAFCTIPQFRGKQRSRTIADIVREAEQLTSQGVKELNLISQDTIAYGRDLKEEQNTNLATLLEQVANAKGIEWVRVFYLYPELLKPELLDVLANHPKIVKYIDMPLQHASNAMLKRMKRGHGIDRQKRVVETLRSKIPGLSLRTAFIVGHPGETEKDFDELCEFVEWGQFEHLGVFRYSDEETCESYTQSDKIPETVISKRYRQLMSLQRKISRKKNKSLLGKELAVLVEGPSEEHEFVMKGRHQGQAPEVDGSVFLSGEECFPGQIRKVRVDQASDYDLVGEIMDNMAPPKKKKTGLKVFKS